MSGLDRLFGFVFSGGRLTARMLAVQSIYLALGGDSTA